MKGRPSFQSSRGRDRARPKSRILDANYPAERRGSAFAGSKISKTFALLLIAVLVTTAGCSAEYVGAETPVDDEGSAPTPIVSTTAETPTSVTAVTTTTTIAERALSPAWVEARQLDSILDTYAVDDEHFQQITANYLRSEKDYWWNNPNQLSTPIGALCWAIHELSRSSLLVHLRVSRDEHYNEIATQLGLVIENSGQAPADALLEFLTSAPDTTVENPVSANENIITTTSTPQTPTPEESIKISEEEQLLAFYRHPFTIEWIRLTEEKAGDGTEWATAIRVVSAPEIEAATKAGDGLPAEAQQFANALFDLVDEYQAGSKTERPDHYRLPGFEGFLEVAKYAPDCKRLYPDIFREPIS